VGPVGFEPTTKGL